MDGSSDCLNIAMYCLPEICKKYVQTMSKNYSWVFVNKWRPILIYFWDDQFISWELGAFWQHDHSFWCRWDKRLRKLVLEQLYFGLWTTYASLIKNILLFSTKQHTGFSWRNKIIVLSCLNFLSCISPASAIVEFWSTSNAVPVLLTWCCCFLWPC